MEQMSLDLSPKAIVVLSGGQDSTTCLFAALRDGFEVYPITFNYGQRHQAELDAAHVVVDIAAKWYPGKVKEHEVIDLGPVLKSTSPLVSDTPLAQYQDHQHLPGGLEATFVPMRNQLFLTIAANRAVHRKASAVYTGVCEEDFGGYPDCRRVFIDALERAVWEALDKSPDTLSIVTPLMHLTKRQTVDLALSLPGCYEALAWSHTAYDGKFPPIGKDHASLLRAKGFELAGIPDPLVLRAVSEGKMQYPETSNYSPAKCLRYAEIAGLKVP